MTIYTTKHQIWETIRGLVHPKELQNATEEIYTFAISCHENKNFTERQAVLFTKKYLAENTEESFKELWSVISMFALEGVANSCVWEIVGNADDRFEMKHVAMETLHACARHYNFDNNFRRVYELSQEAMTAKLYPEAAKLITYATTGIVHEVRRAMREKNPIHVPDKLATLIAMIKKITNEHGADLSNEEILAILIESNVKLPKSKKDQLKTINNLKFAAIANESLTEYDLEWVLNTLESDEDIQEEFIEHETAMAISENLAKITAKVYGYESGFIMHMLHSSLELTGKAMSTYDMVDPMIEFRLTSHYVDCAIGSEAMADTIKMSMVKNGIENAHTDLNDMEAFHLNNAIMRAKADKENIERGELTEEMVLGTSTKQGSINYKFRSMYPIKPIVASEKALASHRAYCNALCNAGLASFADAIKAHVINY